jgi:arylsulfatase A-like enzyme
MEEGALDMNPSRERDHGLIYAHGRWVDRREGVAQRQADSTTDQALEWLSEAEGPFFQWVHYFDPHDPWLIPPDAYMQKYGVRREADDSMSTVYDADIDFMDAQIGRLIQAYRDSGLYDNTIIMVIADHGQGLNDHDWFRHRILYREQIRVPLILRLPNGPRARRVTELVRNIDLLPDNVEGVSLLGLINGEPEPPRIAYAEALNTADVHLPPEMPEHHKDLLFCVMDRNWKLIYHKEHPENSELYDLTNDPHERINVIAEYPDEQIRLMEFLENTGGLAVRTTGVAPIDDQTRRGLKALGYIDDGGDGG